MYQAWICYRKASVRGSSQIAARSPGMVVVGAVVAPTSARAFPVIYIQRRRSGMALVYPTEPSREIADQREGRLWGMRHEEPFKIRRRNGEEGSRAAPNWASSV
jgi:hypothetical protein